MVRQHLKAAATTGLIATILVIAWGTTRARAQVSPNGGEFQINSYTPNGQFSPSIAADSQGNFVVVWESWGSSSGDTSTYSIQGRRFAASGAAVGGDFQVNAYTTGAQRNPAIATDPQGNFVVVWHSYGASGGDTSGASIQAQRYDATGAALGGQFQINTYTTSEQRLPVVAVDPQGTFVVVWESSGSSSGDTSAYSIQAQRYDANGTALGGQFQVNSYTTNGQYRPAVASDASGNFIVAWQSSGSSGADTSAYSIQAQRYDADGTPLGNEFQVNSFTTDAQSWPAVAAEPQGNFLVAWESLGSSGSDGDASSIQGQRYDASGVPLAGQFQVNTYTTSTQVAAAVASDARGNFVVAWRSFGSAGNDTSSSSIQAQRYDASGVLLAGQFQVNTYTTSDQRFPAIATDAQGNFVVTWDSYGSSGVDASGWGILGQRYDGLFRDGFETGDLSRWSGSIP